MKRLVIGTRNKGKLAEWTAFLEDALDVIPISGFPNVRDPEETGRTFEENAKIKASSYAKQTGEYVFSEDGGFEIDYLRGAPGVESRRILPGGKEGTDQDLINYVFERLKGVTLQKRRARLRVVAVVSDPKGNIIWQKEGALSGFVPEEPSSTLVPGYPFRSVLFVPQAGKIYSEFTLKDHDEFNHKKPLAEKLKKFLLESK